MDEKMFNPEVIPYTEDLLEMRKHGRADYPLGAYANQLSMIIGHKVEWHWHNELEISYVVKGSAIFCADKKEYVLSEGDAMLCNHNVIHGIFPREQQDCKFYTLVFSPALIFNFNLTELIEKYYIPLTSSSEYNSFCFKHDVPEDAAIIEIIKRATDINLNKPACYELLSKSCIYELWALLFARYISTPVAVEEGRSASPDELRVSQAISYMEEHYMENISLEDIASFVHISKSECCRCFKRVLHISPIEYLIRYRILEASRRILNGTGDSFSMSSLAEAVGFNSTSYFTKLFKKYMRCTPTSYRKLARKKLKSGISKHALLSEHSPFVHQS